MKRMPVVKVPRPCDCEAWPFCEHGRPSKFTPGPWFVSHEDLLIACQVLLDAEGAMIGTEYGTELLNGAIAKAKKAIRKAGL